jgi:hypothetical protein
MTHGLAFSDTVATDGDWTLLEEDWGEADNVATDARDDGRPLADWTAHWTWFDDTGASDSVDSAAAADQTDQEVRVLLETWLDRVGHSSSIRRATKAPEYKVLLFTGDAAVPAVLDRLREEPDPFLVWLLGDLTNVDPAKGAETISEAAQRWLAWGAAHGRVES